VVDRTGPDYDVCRCQNVALKDSVGAHGNSTGNDPNDVFRKSAADQIDMDVRRLNQRSRDLENPG
jgi:hypothetical protein